MREFLRELRISISGFNKAQPLFPYKIFQRVARAETLLYLSRPRIARPISDGTLFLTQPFVPALKNMIAHYPSIKKRCDTRGQTMKPQSAGSCHARSPGAAKHQEIGVTQ